MDNTVNDLIQGVPASLPLEWIPLADDVAGLMAPEAGAHLHIHHCSTDLRSSGHLHNEHLETRLGEMVRLALYPFADLRSITKVNRGGMDLSEVGVAVVIDDRYGSHRPLRLPWLAAGETERFEVPLAIDPAPISWRGSPLRQRIC